MITPRVAIARSFLTALNRVPGAQRKKVNAFITKFSDNPTSAAINFESLAGMTDPKVRTVRIDLKYRAVVVHPPKGNVYLLVWVDNHDEAMAWAKNKVFDINATTGAIQVLDMEVVEQAAEAAPAEASEPIGLFAELTDDDLARTGLPAVLIPAVRAIETDGQLEKLQPYLPPEAYEALFLIACGYALDTAIRESTQAATAAAEVDPSDFVAALERPASRREFRLVGSEDELLEMLDASLDTWRVFLHPNQQAIVKTNFRGAARVLGGAGTGKTVVAMHRARRLATMFPDETILFATFNRNLATNIGGLLDKLCGPERARIEVTNIHRWVIAKHYRYWGERPNIVDARQADQCWAEALGGGKAALGWTRDDYQAEWKDVVQFYGVSSRGEYLKVSRAGTRKKLTRTERAVIWVGLAAYRAELERRGLVDWPDVIRRVRKHLEDTGESPYRAVVVDEAQDIDAEQWRLLRALAPREDNSLFITGDAHQRIYGKPVALSQFGIHIRGRSRRLKINYRTTEQVLRYATALISSADIDDLDGGGDTTAGYMSLYAGPEPDVRSLASESERDAFIAQRVRELLDGGAVADEIAVVTRRKKRVQALSEVLSGAGIDNAVLDAKSDGPGVRVATMHRVKGLDFTHVIMERPAEIDASDPRNLSLLYVAATRPRKTLTVVLEGK
jgi:hypothetical protein